VLQNVWIRNPLSVVMFAWASSSPPCRNRHVFVSISRAYQCSNLLNTLTLLLDSTFVIPYVFRWRDFISMVMRHKYNTSSVWCAGDTLWAQRGCGVQISTEW